MEDAAGYLAEEAKQDALAGNIAVAAKRAKAALALSKDKSTETDAGIALALAGDESEVAQIVDDLNKQFPRDTMVQVDLASIKACSLLGDGKSPESARQAVKALAANTRYEAGGDGSMIPAYVRGRAYLAAGQSANAAKEFQTILDHFGVTRNFVTGPLARYGLAEAEDQAGDKAKARADYAAFLALWHGADSDLPALKTAKASYAMLSAARDPGQ
jgi:tetratricopeptide (TPR) repeat protein